MNFLLLGLVICFVLLVGEMVIAFAVRRTSRMARGRGEKLRDSEEEKPADNTKEKPAVSNSLPFLIRLGFGGRPVFVGMVGLVILLGITTFSVNGNLRKDRDQLDMKADSLHADLDSLRAMYEGYRGQASKAYEQDLIAHHTFVVDVLKRMASLEQLLEVGRKRISEQFAVDECSITAWIQDNRIRVKEHYTVRKISDEMPSTFQVFLAARSRVEDSGKIDLRCRWKARGEHAFRRLSEDSIRVIERSYEDGEISQFLAEFGLPETRVGEVVEVVFEYTWPWVGRPAQVVCYDPRRYGIVDRLIIYIALKGPLEYMLLPKFDPAVRGFNLFRYPEPYRITSYNPGSSYAEQIAGTWEDDFGERHAYNVYHLDVSHANVPVAILFQQSGLPIDPRQQGESVKRPSM